MEYSKIEKYYGSTSILVYIDEIEKNCFNINNYFTKYNKRRLSFEFDFNKFYNWYKTDLGIINILFKKIYYQNYYWNLNIKDNCKIIEKNNKQYKIDIENLIDIRVLIYNRFKLVSLSRYKLIFYLVLYYIDDNKLKAIELPYSGIKSLLVFWGKKRYNTEIISESEKTYFLNLNDIVRLKSMFVRKDELDEELDSSYENIRKETNEIFEKKLAKLEKKYNPFVRKINNKFGKLVKLKEKEEKFIQKLENWENVKR